MHGLLQLYELDPKFSLFCGCSVVFFCYYITNVARRPRLICNNGFLKDFIEKHCPSSKNTYWPTFWCFESRLMTIAASILRIQSQNIMYNREIILLKDGGQLALDWFKSKEENLLKKPIAIFLPGLTGHSKSPYIQRLVLEAHNAGYRPVVMINRGVGDLPLLTSRVYCGISSNDLKFTLEHIKQKYPSTSIVATGISLGGIILGRYLVESGEKSLISAAMIISGCYDLVEGAKSLESTWLNRMLNRSLTVTCVGLVKEHSKMFEDNKNINLNAVYKSQVLREFDDSFTSKMFNYGTAENYYREASLKKKLHCVKIPLLLLNAADDVFAPESTLPCVEIQKSSHVAMILTSHGGHIAFMEGILPTGRFFFEKLYSEYVQGVHSILRNESIS